MPDLHRYAEGVEAAPGRLDEVEERMALLERLKRKHGGTITAVLAYAEDLRTRRDELTGAEEAIEAAEARAGRGPTHELTKRGREAPAPPARPPASRSPTRSAIASLALAMEGAEFTAALHPRQAFGPTGADEVEFLIATSLGVPAGPPREIASGGELHA